MEGAIKQFINVISVCVLRSTLYCLDPHELKYSQSSKKARKKKSNSVMSGARISRLKAFRKEQIISSVELLLEKQQNGSDLAQQLEEVLPRVYYKILKENPRNFRVISILFPYCFHIISI
eukprot:184365_1